MARIAGVRPQQIESFEGIDIIQHVVARRPNRTRTLYWRKPRGDTVREGDLKYIGHRRGEAMREYLFDLSSDLSEKHNLKDQRVAEFQDLRRKYLHWEQVVRKNRRGRPER